MIYLDKTPFESAIDTKFMKQEITEIKLSNMIFSVYKIQKNPKVVFEKRTKNVGSHSFYGKIALENSVLPVVPLV